MNNSKDTNYQVNNAIKNAIAFHFIMNFSDTLNDIEYASIINSMNQKTLKKIDDIYLLRTTRLKNNINFNRLDRKQIIRLMTRDISIFDKVDLGVFKFSPIELGLFFATHPEKVRCFNFSINKLSGREVVILLKADLNYVYELNFKEKKWSRLDLQDLIKYFSDIEEVMSNIKFEELDNFLIKTVIINTREKYLDLLDLNKLNDTDWIQILEKFPDMITYCDLKLFEQGSGDSMAQLACISKEGEVLLEKNLDKLSAFAWEKLLLHNAEKYAPICNFNLFTNTNWKNLINKKPYLRKFKSC